ncbi:deoxyuridine 5'-triphosphate nucleotidohydrolase isoform X2 [Coregonus clupeaformis]|uniref:deoxyuridine 5'-triphosphate nucleotidohydrolase isoform X2 n=1 Tax=Coregonus clupeaformis TaxID=59861 RepID=UPI001BE07D00|nr:deoxyuridine 5'-triphosphate nucleotidohydrolase isoform X2 [Coregonus clupeaformis]
MIKHPQHDGKPRELFQNRAECFRKQCFDSGKVNQLARHCCHFITEVTDAAEVSPLKRTRPDAVAEDVKIPVLKFSKLSEHATAPTRGSAKAAGYDLFSAYDYSIGPMDKAIVKTDIQIAVPSGCYGRVAPRSGLAAKHFIDVGAGVVDEDYRGNVGVVLFNFSKETFEVKRGDRVAQLVCERICYPDLQELKTLDETERGSGGFGSTGSN